MYIGEEWVSQRFVLWKNRIHPEMLRKKQFKIPNISQNMFPCLFLGVVPWKLVQIVGPSFHIIRMWAKQETSHAEAVTSGMALGAKWRLGSQVFHQQMVAKKNDQPKTGGSQNTPKVVGWVRWSWYGLVGDFDVVQEGWRWIPNLKCSNSCTSQVVMQRNSLYMWLRLVLISR